MAAVLMSAGVWAVWLSAPSLTPWIVTVFAICNSLLAAVSTAARIRRGRRDELGLQGELSTAEWLAELSTFGYRVFHDLQGPKGNIDHAAVGRAGVFVVETKARSKRRGDRIEYDGRRLLVGGWDVTDQYLGQARACRDEVYRKLRCFSELTANIPVRGIVVFPGWDVEEQGSSGAEVWVLNPKRRVAAWIKQEERRAAICSDAQVSVAVAMFDAWSREPR